MRVTRTEINAETVCMARALAAAKALGVNTFADTRDRYLQIRRRGGRRLARQNPRTHPAKTRDPRFLPLLRYYSRRPIAPLVRQ
jgi:hypothetical protein